MKSKSCFATIRIHLTDYVCVGLQYKWRKVEKPVISLIIWICYISFVRNTWIQSSHIISMYWYKLFNPIIWQLYILLYEITSILTRHFLIVKVIWIIVLVCCLVMIWPFYNFSIIMCTFLSKIHSLNLLSCYQTYEIHQERGFIG